MNHANNDPEIGLYLLSMVIALLFYMLPTFIAFGRRHHRRWQILAANLFLGWTFLFWVYSLIAALSPSEHERS